MLASSARVREFLKPLVDMPECELAVAADAFREMTLERGEFLVTAGQRTTVVGLVLEGLLRKFYTTQKGRELTRGFASSGELVGAYAALLTDSISTLTIQALEKSRVLLLDFGNLQRLFATHPSWNTVGRRIAESLFLEREQREMALLTLSAAERYDQFRRQHADLVERVPQYQIASYLGITPVSLSRIRARLKHGRPLEL
jgi:CRP-like cAMP-binding protein